MNIRNKLILFSVGAIIIAVAAIGTIAAWQFNNYAGQAFETQAILEIRRIDTVLSQFVSNGRRSAERLAKSPLLYESEGKFTKYYATTTNTELLYDKHTPYEQAVYKLFMEARLTDPALGLIFMGSIDGGFAQAPEKDVLKPGYDPRTRQWYVEALAHSEDINISKVYTSTSGALVTSVTSLIKTPQGKFVGVLALDLDLSLLTSYIKNLKIGERGYAMVFDKDGTILVDPKDNPLEPKTFFKKINEDVLPSLLPVVDMAQGFTTVELDGQKMNVAVYTSASLGWKVATLIPTEEVHRVSNNMVYMIISLGAAICLICAIVMLLVARSITKPIDMVVNAAGAIAAGDFNALPPAKHFSGEMLRLHTSLYTMVSELGQLVSTAETKSKEAEEQSKKAAAAVAEAENARKEAEQAQRAGMLQAASQLEDIVGETRRTAEDMAQQITRAALGAQTQNKHSEETTTAMQEMNATSMEVSRTSMQAAETAQETTSKAQGGAQSVFAVKQAIGEVAQKTESLKEVINNLGEQAHDINQIITVITDIADQTNLLALNAAIEAARAGEYGRGFAVVADEVRKLAEKTMVATKEVGSSIRSIQAGTEESVQGMDDATKSVARSTELASEAEQALHEILDLSTVTSEQVQSIAAASEEQSAASTEVGRITDAIHHIAGETVESMDSASAAVKSLNELAHKLEDLIIGLKNS